MTRPVSRTSLRTELLVNFAILAIAALFFAVAICAVASNRKRRSSSTSSPTASTG